MTCIETYKLVLDTLTAFGTVGAVCVALWATIRQPPAFSFHGVEMQTYIVLDEGMKEKERSDFIVVKLENHRDVQMTVYNISINAYGGSKEKHGLQGGGMVFPLKNVFAPPKSLYHFKCPVKGDWEAGTFSNATEITCTVATSFGDKTIDFPKQWRGRLVEVMECPEGAV